MRKRRLFLVAGACAAVLSLGVGSVAFADPVPPTPTRPHPGVGSNTTEDVMNGFANGVTFSVPAFPGGIVNGAGQRTLSSWNALGSTPIRYKDSPPECQSVNIRPNGSTQGVNALRGITPPAGPFPAQCADWARSSANSAPSRPGQNLRFIPFAVDTVTFATLGTTTVPKSLSLPQLKSIYEAPLGSSLCNTFKPVLPQTGSGTRSFWLGLIGTAEGALGSCVNSSQGGVAPEEHDCRTLSSAQELVPYGVAQYITQTQQPAITNRAGNCQLRAIGGRYSTELSATHPGSRQVYNVLKGEDVGNPALPDLNAAFVGPTSQVCSRPEVITAYGLKPIPAGDPNPCGSQISTP